MSPGITGPWQILGSSRVPVSDMVSLDYLYCANWSLWLDAKILARTMPYVLSAQKRRAHVDAGAERPSVSPRRAEPSAAPRRPAGTDEIGSGVGRKVGLTLGT